MFLDYRLIPFVADHVLDEQHRLLHQACAAPQDYGWTASALDEYHVHLVTEMLERGRGDHESWPKACALFQGMCEAEERDPLSAIMPFSSATFLLHAAEMYRNNLYVGGRLDADPEIVAASFEWASREQLVAAVLLLEDYSACNSGS